MNKNMILVIVVILLGLGGYFTFTKMNPTKTSKTTGSSVIAPNTVTISNFAFSPDTLTVKAGDTLTFVNKDLTGHSVTADDGTFDTGVFDSGSSKTVTIAKPGTYNYHCTVHPSMKGKIIVEQ